METASPIFMVRAHGTVVLRGFVSTALSVDVALLPSLLMVPSSVADNCQIWKKDKQTKKHVKAVDRMAATSSYDLFFPCSRWHCRRWEAWRVFWSTRCSRAPTSPRGRVCSGRR